MKRGLFLLVALLVISGVSLAQVEIGSKGQVFNQATECYSSTAFIATTATATTAKIPFYPATNIRVFAVMSDTLHAEISYRLTNSTIGFTTPYRILDTVITHYLCYGFAGGGTTYDTTVVLGHTINKYLAVNDTLRLSPNELTGYDQIQFQIDYLSGTSAGNAAFTLGGTRFFKLYYYFLKP